MGCDIHFVVEQKFDDRWIGVFSTDAYVYPMTGKEAKHRREQQIPLHAEFHPTSLGNLIYARWPTMKARHYKFFARLAGVRGDGPEAKGVPDDASELTRVEVSRWGEDAHSHSWDTLEDFSFKWLQCQGAEEVAYFVAEQLKGNKPRASAIFGAPDDECRIVYWFDN